MLCIGNGEITSDVLVLAVCRSGIGIGPGGQGVNTSLTGPDRLRAVSHCKGRSVRCHRNTHIIGNRVGGGLRLVRIALSGHRDLQDTADVERIHCIGIRIGAGNRFLAPIPLIGDVFRPGIPGAQRTAHIDQARDGQTSCEDLIPGRAAGCLPSQHRPAIVQVLCVFHENSLALRVR